MIYMITGGSGSGKSAYAEDQVLRLGEKKRIYIATMIPYGEEGQQRVERHRRLRSRKQFETVECYTHLEQVRIPEKAVVLLECLSNLTANEMYEPDGAGEAAPEAVLRGIRHLAAQTDYLFVVTNEVFSDGIRYDPETMRYLRILGQINTGLAALADQVTEVICGIPVRHKG